MKLGLFGLATAALALCGETALAQQVIVAPAAPVVVPAYTTYPGVVIGGGIRTRGGLFLGGTYSTAPVVPAYGTLSTPVVPGSAVVPGPVVVQSAPAVSVGVGVVPYYQPGFYPYYGRPYYRYFRR